MRLAVNLLKVLVSGLLLLYGVGNIAAVAAGALQRHRIAADITAVLPRILSSAREAQEELVVSVGHSPDRRWVEQACRFDRDYGGWLVIDWREVCVMRSVTAWQVDSEREARALVAATEDGRGAIEGCRPLGTVGEPGVVEGPEATYVDWSSSTDAPWCIWELGDVGDARTLAGERVEWEEGRWLVLVAEQPLVDEATGCAHWSVVFCDNPWTDHAFGKTPEV